MADRTTLGQRSHRVATRRQSLSLPNIISILLHRLYRRLSTAWAGPHNVMSPERGLYRYLLLRPAKGAGASPFVFKRVPEPIDIRQVAQHGLRANVAADLTGGDAKG